MIPGPKPRRYLLLALALAAAAVAVALALASSTPDWAARPPTPGDPRLAEAFEHAVIRQLTAPRDGDPRLAGPDDSWASFIWSVSLNEADVQAWLSHRLHPWAENRGLLREWPPGVSAPIVAFTQGEVLVGVRVDGRLLHFTCAPRVAEDGGLWLDTTGAGVGGLSLPPELVLPLLPDVVASPSADPDGKSGLLQALRGDRPLVAAPIIPLEGRRRVRILKLTPSPGRLDVTCQTEIGR